MDIIRTKLQTKPITTIFFDCKTNPLTNALLGYPKFMSTLDW